MSQDPHTLLLPSSSSSSRRLPPPCWSPDETVSLIDVYREKWYSLRRGNLRANHWQEVADAVADRCPGAPQKTSVQCRHKMEKLRKRYRAEIQRAVAATPNGHRYISSWVHFNRMDAMEKGSPVPMGAATAVVALNAQPIYRGGEDDEEDGEEEVDFYSGRGVIKEGIPINPGFYGSVASNGVGGNSGAGPFRIKIPGRSNAVEGMPPTAKVYSKFNECNANYGHSPTFNSGGGTDGYVGRFGIERNGGGSSSGGGGGGGKRRERNPVDEMVDAIKMLGDGFVRMERMKMDMAKEIEGMRMEMEMKRTEMILESQQKVVETFAKTLLESNQNKKAKRMPSPES